MPTFKLKIVIKTYIKKNFLKSVKLRKHLRKHANMKNDSSFHSKYACAHLAIFLNPQSEVYKQTIHPCGSDMSLERMGVIGDQVGVAMAWKV